VQARIDRNSPRGPDCDPTEVGVCGVKKYIVFDADDRARHYEYERFAAPNPTIADFLQLAWGWCNVPPSGQVLSAQPFDPNVIRNIDCHVNLTRRDFAARVGHDFEQR
jgi:hypothetical protein